MSGALTRIIAICVIGGAVSFGAPPMGPYDSARSAPYHPAIHNLGNVGATGRMHAQVAQLATWAIDQVAYRGLNMRRALAEEMAARYENGTSVVEIGCGVGVLTVELEQTGVLDVVAALDTSEPMLEVARRTVRGPLRLMNGLDFGQPVDVAVVCMVMHEMPEVAHRELLRTLCSVATDVWIVDIDPAYTPSGMMLSGEPYVPEYLTTIERSIRHESEGRDVEVFALVPGHVKVWVLQSG